MSKATQQITDVLVAGVFVAAAILFLTMVPASSISEFSGDIFLSETDTCTVNGEAIIIGQYMAPDMVTIYTESDLKKEAAFIFTGTSLGKDCEVTVSVPGFLFDKPVQLKQETPTMLSSGLIEFRKDVISETFEVCGRRGDTVASFYGSIALKCFIVTTNIDSTCNSFGVFPSGSDPCYCLKVNGVYSVCASTKDEVRNLYSTNCAFTNEQLVDDSTDQVITLSSGTTGVISENILLNLSVNKELLEDSIIDTQETVEDCRPGTWCDRGNQFSCLNGKKFNISLFSGFEGCPITEAGILGREYCIDGTVECFGENGTLGFKCSNHSWFRDDADTFCGQRCTIEGEGLCNEGFDAKCINGLILRTQPEKVCVKSEVLSTFSYDRYATYAEFYGWADLETLELSDSETGASADSDERPFCTEHELPSITFRQMTIGDRILPVRGCPPGEFAKTQSGDNCLKCTDDGLFEVVAPSSCPLDVSFFSGNKIGKSKCALDNLGACSLDISGINIPILIAIAFAVGIALVGSISYFAFVFVTRRKGTFSQVAKKKFKKKGRK